MKFQVILVAFTNREVRVWSEQLSNIMAVKELSEIADVHLFDGRASVKARRSKSLLHRLAPQLSDHVEELDNYVREISAKGDAEFLFVGYERGGSTIKSYLVRQLEEENSLELVRKVRRVIFLNPKAVTRFKLIFFLPFVLAVASLVALRAYEHYSDKESNFFLRTALEGLSLAATLAAGFMLVFLDPDALKKLGLNVGNLELPNLDRRFGELILQGSKSAPGTWPIPTQELQSVALRNADHADIRKLVESLIKPIPHQNVYEVDLDSRWDVFSVDEDDPSKRLKVTYTRQVKFSDKDSVTPDSRVAPWEIKYSTSGKLDLISTPKDQNDWSSDEAAHFENQHSRYVYRCWPKPGAAYKVSMCVLGGYEPHHMDSHAHIRPDSNIHLFRWEVDFRSLLKLGYTLARNPEAYYLHPVTSENAKAQRALDIPCSKLEDEKNKFPRTDIPNRSQAAGLFTWEMTDVRNGGIFAYEFDLRPPAHSSSESSRTTKGIAPPNEELD